jgi:hypothetical protein
VSALPAKIFDLLYGQPGTGKSENVARLAERVYRETGKTTRIVIGDGSALTYEHLRDMQVADLCFYGGMPYPFTVIERLCRGWWLTDDGVLVPPGAPGNDLTTVGLYVFEGISVIARHLLNACADKAADGVKLAQDAAIRFTEGTIDPRTGKVTDGPGTVFAGNAPAHYGFVQGKVLEAIADSQALPCHVLWTAHEATNNPDADALNKGELLAGPEVVGKALTASIQKSFNNTLHCCTVSKRAKQQDSFTGRATDELDLEYRLYTRDHFAPSGNALIRYKGCTRNGDANTPQYLTSTEPGLTLPAFYDMLADVRKVRSAGLVRSVVAPSEETASR